MRLGQLARKLEIRPAEIVEFLSRNNIKIEDGTNTRIEDDHATLVIKHFNPTLLLAEIPEEKEDEKQITVTEPVAIEQEEQPVVFNEIVEKVSESVSTSVEEVIAKEEIEVIKAPKTELPGLKVLGKIELPETKKKEAPKTETDSTENQGEQVKRTSRSERRPTRNNNPRREEPWKNPIALQREREAKADVEKRKAQLEQEKEKRMLHYMKKVKKTEQPVKSNRVENEPQEQVEVQVAPPPKTLWGKFMRWLST